MKLSVVILPLLVARDTQDTIGCVVIDEHVLTMAPGSVNKRWSESRNNNGYLPTDASPMVTNSST